MTRIISGFAGSRELRVPKTGTRPTSDRVREAVFSTLEALGEIEGARVLDLYAGSGALGLEALSRGAASVTFVEFHPATAKILKANAELVRQAGNLAPGAVDVRHSRVSQFLAGSSAKFDLVFIDPPYELDDAELTTELPALTHLLSEHAVIVVERSKRSSKPTVPAGLELESEKFYGDTAIYRLVTTPNR